MTPRVSRCSIDLIALWRLYWSLDWLISVLTNYAQLSSLAISHDNSGI